MSSEYKQKSISKSVSLYPEEWAFVEELTKSKFRDRSAFFRDAIAKTYPSKSSKRPIGVLNPGADTDKAGKPIQALFEFYRPALANKVAGHLKKVPDCEQNILDNLLSALAIYLEHCDPETYRPKVQIISQEEYLDMQFKSVITGATIASSNDDEIDPQQKLIKNKVLQMVAEQKSDYNSKKKDTP